MFTGRFFSSIFLFNFLYSFACTIINWILFAVVVVVDITVAGVSSIRFTIRYFLWNFSVCFFFFRRFSLNFSLVSIKIVITLEKRLLKLFCYFSFSRLFFFNEPTAERRKKSKQKQKLERKERNKCLWFK